MKMLLSAYHRAKLLSFYRHARPYAHNIWKFLNSPFVITLVTGLLITLITREYATLDANRKDLADRREKLTVALAEFQQRISYLQATDRLWKQRCDYIGASTKEWNIISGTGNYISASPIYKNVQLMVVMNDLEINSGINDIRGGLAQFIAGDLSFPSPYTARSVRPRLTDLSQYAFTLSLFISSGELPLPHGQAPDKALGLNFEIPSYTPDLTIKLDKEADAAHNKLQKDIGLAENRSGKESATPCQKLHLH